MFTGPMVDRRLYVVTRGTAVGRGGELRICADASIGIVPHAWQAPMFRLADLAGFFSL